MSRVKSDAPPIDKDAEKEDKNLRHELVILECRRRAELYNTLKQNPNLLVHHIFECAKDPVLWINDFAWAPDPYKQFGSKAVPDELAPAGMVPIIPSPKQEEFVRELWAALVDDGKWDVVLEKSRQVAATTLTIWVLLLAWLTLKTSYGVLSTYDDDLIDKGGKEQREPDSLFGRFRMFLDAFMWTMASPSGTEWISTLRFNQQERAPARPKQREAYLANRTGLREAQDIGGKITRGRWIVHNAVLFPEAEGNYILGQLPKGEKAGRSLALLFMLFDEFEFYSKEIGKDADRQAWTSSGANVKVRIALSTIPRGGGIGSQMAELVARGDAEGRRVISMHWTDLGPYMLGASRRCPHCQRWDRLGPRDGPGRHGKVMPCSLCGKEARVRRKDVWSPWFIRECERAGWDKVAIACELDLERRGAIGDRFFHTYDGATAPGPFRGAMMVDGFDPGTSSTHPGAWISVAMDPRTLRPRIVGYYCASDKTILWWLPFFKRWGPHDLGRMTMPYGPQAGRPWLEVNHYPVEALWMLERMSIREGGPPVYPMGRIMGDKFGSHRQMWESPYQILARYGVFVEWEYTADRALLCQRGVDWAGRLEIDEELEAFRPAQIGARQVPTISEVFMSAKPVMTTGQTERYDVDKQDPAFVSNPADAWFYACRAFPSEVRAMMTAGGTYEEVGMQPAHVEDKFESGGIWE